MRPNEAPYYSLRLPDYAATIAVTQDVRVLAVRQYRPALERFTLELPSGIIDPGEAPRTAAQRELREEAGYDGPDWEELPPATVDNGRMSNSIRHFVACGVRPLAGWIPEEGIEVLTLSIPELRTAILSGEFDHALHLAGLLQALLARKIEF